MSVSEWLELPASKQSDYLKLVETLVRHISRNCGFMREETHENELVEKSMIHHVRYMINKEHKYN